MLNEFGSYADALDNKKPDLSRKNLNLAPDRSNCYAGNVSDIGPRPSNLPAPAATWNCNPYLGNFYNYYGNNSYDTSDVHQYDNRKCGVNQFAPRNYTQHAIPSASVLQCCDPRCQLFSDHSKYPFSNTLANKYNNHQRTKPAKNCYDGLEQPTTASSTNVATPLKLDKSVDRSKYPSFAYTAPMQPNMNKFNGPQPPNYNSIYQNPVKPSKHVFLPSPDASSYGDYYTDTGKPSYWNKQNSNLWNRGIPNSYYPPPPPPPPPPQPPPPPPSSFDHVDKMQQKMAAASSVAHHQHHEQSNVTTAAAAAAAAAANQRGILFNRLLDHRNRALYDPSYLPNYHYGGPPPPSDLPTQSHKNPAAAAAYYQSYQDREMYPGCNNPTGAGVRVPPSSLQNSNSYQSLPMYNLHYVDPTAAAAAAAANAATAHKETKDSKAEENKNRLLDKNPNLDVREFLSTWDDVEDDKAPEAETPVIVLDCTSLEAEALAKVKEKLAENISDCSPIENPPTAIEFNSHAGNATVLKVIDDQIVSPHASVIQESVLDNSFAANAPGASKKDKLDNHHHTPNKFQADSSHSDGYNNMWYGSGAASEPHKKKNDLSYDFIEMTERIVNTVGQLIGDEKGTHGEKDAPAYEPHHHHKEVPEKLSEDEWNINFSYNRNKTAAPHGLVVPEPRYNRPVKDDVMQDCKTYADQPEKNVSCSFNLQKTSNDLKFSVNYSKQTENYATRVPDSSVKCKTTTTASCEKNDRYKATSQQRMEVEDYSYKNYYNSYYYNNPNYEYMQMHNVKECTYDVENIDREISNDNATDITLVKADLEKSLKEITHQFSYQKKIESTEKELHKGKPPPPPYDYSHSQNYLNSAKNDVLEMPKLDETGQDLTCDKSTDSTNLGTSVIQKTGSCNEKPIYDERDDLYNDNSMLSMPSLSPPATAQESRSLGTVGLTLNDVYEDEVIFDTLNKPSHAEDKQPAGEENCLNFLNIVKNDDKRESVVYPLNLALTKDKDQPQSMVKFTNVVGGDNQDESSVDAKEPDTVSKVDDGYYSVENHFDKDNKNEFDNLDNEAELKTEQVEDAKKIVYKTCIVSREQYEEPALPKINQKLPRTTEYLQSKPSLEVVEPRVSNFTPPASESTHVPIEEASKSPERDLDSLSDIEYRDKLLDDSSKFHNSSTDEEKLLKSSKFKKYKKLKKLKIKELENGMLETGSGVIKENGNVTNFKNIFPNIRSLSVEESCNNELIDDESDDLLEKSPSSRNKAISSKYLRTKSSLKTNLNGHAGSLPVLVTGDEIDNLENDFKVKKRKFTSFVKDADLPVKKRKQGMAIEQNFTDKDKNQQPEEMESVPVAESSSLCVADVVATTIATATEEMGIACEGSSDKYLLNGKYPVDTKNELADQKITAEPELVAVATPVSPSASTEFVANDFHCRQKPKKKHKKDKDRVKNKSSKKQKKKEKLCYERRKSSSYNDDLKSPDRTMLDDVFNDPYKFRSSGSEQVTRLNDEGNETHSHAIRDDDDENVQYLSNSNSNAALYEVRPEIRDDEPIARNVSVLDDNTMAAATSTAPTTMEKSSRSTSAEIIPICVNFNDESTRLTRRDDFQEDEHEAGRSRERYNWCREKHALSDGENYTSRSHKKIKSYHKNALSDDENRRPFCTIFKAKFVDEPRQNSVISFPTQPPSLEIDDKKSPPTPEAEPSYDQTFPENPTESTDTFEEPASTGHEYPASVGHESPASVGHESPSSVGHESPKISEIENPPSPAIPSPPSETIKSPPRSPIESAAPYDEPVSSVKSHSSESNIFPEPETVQEPPNNEENHPELSTNEIEPQPDESDPCTYQSPQHYPELSTNEIEQQPDEPDSCTYQSPQNYSELSTNEIEPQPDEPDPCPYQSPLISAPNSPCNVEPEDLSAALPENLTSHHEIEAADLSQTELPHEEDPKSNEQAENDKTISPYSSKEPSPRCDSPKEDYVVHPTVENSTWSCENSPHTNFVEEYEPQFVSWSPGPIVGECTVETSHNEVKEEEENETQQDTRWCENSPFHLDDNIDHEEAISNVPELGKSTWSNDNTPIASDDETETHIPSRASSPANYDHDTRSTTRSPANSPYHSDIESPKRSISSSSSESSDSDQSDVEDKPTRHRKISSSKSSSSKASHIDSSDDEDDKRCSPRKYDSDDESLPRSKSPCKDDSDECSVCNDDSVNKLDDDLFNIPSVAPTPNCDLNREEDEMDESIDMLKDSGKLSDINSKAPSPNCVLHDEEDEEVSSAFSMLNNNIILNNHLSNERTYYDSDRSNVSSVAPSPKCDIIDGVLLDDTSRISDGFGFEKSFVPASPTPQLATTVAEPAIVYEEVPSLRELSASVLAKLSISAVPSFNRNNLLEVWVTPERTEIIIHSEDNEPSQTDLVINDNQVMITDAYGDDEDVNNMATNFDQIKEIAFDYSTMGMESSISATNDKTDEELQCQCLIISSEESIVCLRCSLNSSIIVNQDLDIESNYIGDKSANDVMYGNTEISLYENENENENELCDLSTFVPTNCIEDSFIDHKILITPERTAEEIIETEFAPIDVTTQTTEDLEADNEVQNITDSSPTTEAPVRNPRHVQLKVQLPWQKIFNLNQINNQFQVDQNVLELGPAKIQVRLSPDDPKLLKLVDLKEERVSPVVNVARLVLQRASEMPEKLNSEISENDDVTSGRKSALDVAANKDITSRLPKMVIKKTNYKEYKSFLQLNTLQPVVKLYKNKSLDELARKMCKLKNYSINLKQLKSLSFPDGALDDDVFKTDTVSRHQRKPDQDDRPVIPEIDSKCDHDEPVNPALSDMSSKRDLAPIPESHHCLLCHRSFPSEDSYRIHIKGRFHRHLELTQRKTIHAMYRHFTGHICPRLRPLSSKERKKMKWKPRSANVNHFYHEKTPLQIALHKSVFENKPDAKCS